MSAVTFSQRPSPSGAGYPAVTELEAGLNEINEVDQL